MMFWAKNRFSHVCVFRRGLLLLTTPHIQISVQNYRFSSLSLVAGYGTAASKMPHFYLMAGNKLESFHMLSGCAV